jgi:hypothetical protein
MDGAQRRFMNPKKRSNCVCIGQFMCWEKEGENVWEAEKKKPSLLDQFLDVWAWSEHLKIGQNI